MEKTIDFYLGVSHATGHPVLKADDGTTFQLTDQQGKWGYTILRNGKKDKKFNEAIALFKAYDEIEDVFNEPYTGSIFSIDNNGTMLIWSNGQWNIYTKDSKVETDIALQALNRKPLFGTSIDEQVSHIKKTIPENKNGTFFSWPEYFQASIYSRRNMFSRLNKRLDNVKRAIDGVTYGLWGTNYNDSALTSGALLDMLRNPDMTYAEVNAKWGTSIHERQKGVIGKILGSTVIGALTGGPIGAVVGFATSTKAVTDKDKALREQARIEAKEVSNVVSEIKKTQEIKKQQEQQSLQASGISLQSNWMYLLIGGVLLVGVYFLFVKK